MKKLEYFGRLLVRPIALMLLAAISLAALEYLVAKSASGEVTFALRFPELMKALTAVAVLTFAESVLMVTRLCAAPKVDVQAAALHAQFDRRGAATVYAVHQAVWAARLAAFLLLYGWL